VSVEVPARLDAMALVISILAAVFSLLAPVGINNRTATWTPASLPADRREQEHRWDVDHWRRTGGLLVAFLLLTLSLSCSALRICGELLSSEGGPPSVKISPMPHKLAFLTVGAPYDPEGSPAHGCSAFRFNFAKPLDAAGNSCRLDRAAMDAKTRGNAAPRV
jgi:hypothetical protein